MKNSIRSNLCLSLAAILWGITFVAQSAAMDNIGPLTFFALRSLLGALVLLPVLWLTGGVHGVGGREAVDLTPEQKRGNWRVLIRGGTVCGLIMLVAALLQQYGIVYTTVGKASFITALYIVIVPLLGGLLGKKVPALVWAGVGIAVVGIYLMCIKEQLTLALGDLLVLFCAVAFAGHILAVDRYCDRVQPVALSIYQFLLAGIIAFILMFILEKPSWPAIRQAWFPIAYSGIVSSGIAYTLQIVGQKGTSPPIAALLMSMESVVGAVSGWLLLGQAMTGREIAGAALVLVAILVAQWPASRKTHIPAKAHSTE